MGRFKNSMQLAAEIDVGVTVLQPAHDPSNPDTPISRVPCVWAWLTMYSHLCVCVCVGLHF